MNFLRSLALTLALGLGAASAHAANVLIVLSDFDRLDLKDGKVFKTGFYLNELMQPVKVLIDAGHEVTFATPQGNAPTVDITSVDPAYFGGDAKVMAEYQKLLDRLAITSPVEFPGDQPEAGRTDRLRPFRCRLHTRRACADAGPTGQP